MSKTAIQKAKEKAWKVFSEYIRRKYADKNGYVKCVTCGVIRQWNDDIQAGHFIDGRNNTVLFDERLVYPQCKSCNRFKKGNKVQYTLFMLKQGYTKEEINDFYNLKFKVKKLRIGDFESIYAVYSDKLVALDIKEGKI